MSMQLELVAFIEQAREDVRIGPMHISVYAAILYLQAKQGDVNPVEVSARKLMPVARIYGAGPYHKAIRQLHAFGYLTYAPSCDPDVPSKVWLREG